MTIENKKEIKVTNERSFSPHHLFLKAARDAIKISESGSSCSSSMLLTAIMMAAFAIEALCNAVGERTITSWKDFESASPKAKFRVICEKLGLEYNPQVEPWATVVWLSSLRNSLAHGKPQAVTESYLCNEEEHSKRYWDKPESKLERSITAGNAERAYKQVSELKYLLSKHMPQGTSFGIAGDMWSGSTSA